MEILLSARCNMTPKMRCNLRKVRRNLEPKCGRAPTLSLLSRFVSSASLADPLNVLRFYTEDDDSRFVLSLPDLSCRGGLILVCRVPNWIRAPVGSASGGIRSGWHQEASGKRLRVRCVHRMKRPKKKIWIVDQPESKAVQNLAETRSRPSVRVHQILRSFQEVAKNFLRSF